MNGKAFRNAIICIPERFFYFFMWMNGFTSVE